jgi:hypothetical protein
MARKKGALSNAEREFIAKNAGILEPAAMARAIDRTEELVLRQLRTIGTAVEAARDEGGASSMAWRHLAFEFDGDEVAYFKERWAALNDQFKGDLLLASEEGTLFKAVKLEILMHRNLVQQKRAEEQLKALEQRRVELFTPDRQFDRDEATFLGETLKAAVAAKQDLTTEYTRLDHSHQDILKGLKATREQRISRVESGKRTFIDVIRALCDREAADRADRQIDQMRKATDKELRRLAAPHAYADGLVDRPILNCDTVVLPVVSDDHDGVSAASNPEPEP